MDAARDHRRFVRDRRIPGTQVGTVHTTTQGEDTLHMPDRRRRAAHRLPQPPASHRGVAAGHVRTPGEAPGLGRDRRLSERRDAPTEATALGTGGPPLAARAAPTAGGTSRAAGRGLGTGGLPGSSRTSVIPSIALSTAASNASGSARWARNAAGEPNRRRTSDAQRPEASGEMSGQQPAPGGTPVGDDGGSDAGEHNPFAPPPAGAPDQPWQPRAHADSNGQGGGSDQDGHSRDGDRPDGGGQSGDDERPARPAWGSQWSSRQPGRSSGGFGTDPSRQQGDERKDDHGEPDQGSGGRPRWDPSDPAQRRARYALLAGLWAFFFALFSLHEIALLLGALSVYWAISSLRATPRAGAERPDGGVDAPPPAAGDTRAAQPSPAQPTPAQRSARSKSTAAISGLVTGGLALLITVGGYAFQIAYSDYYTCVDDALTKTAHHACEQKLPDQLRPLLTLGD